MKNLDDMTPYDVFENMLKYITRWGSWSKRDLLNQIRCSIEVSPEMARWTRGELLAYTIEHFPNWED